MTVKIYSPSGAALISEIEFNDAYKRTFIGFGRDADERSDRSGVLGQPEPSCSCCEEEAAGLEVEGPQEEEGCACE